MKKRIYNKILKRCSKKFNYNFTPLEHKVWNHANRGFLKMLDKLLSEIKEEEKS